MGGAKSYLKGLLQTQALNPIDDIETKFHVGVDSFLPPAVTNMMPMSGQGGIDIVLKVIFAIKC